MRFILIYLTFCQLLGANLVEASFFDHKAEGWHWYEDSYQKSETSSSGLSPEDKDQKRNLQLIEDLRKHDKKEDKEPKPQDEPLLRVEAFRKEVDRLKAIAILNPTYSNVKSYMEIQKKLLDRATRFSQTWLEVVYTTPKLDYTLRHPTSQAARHVYLDQERRKMDAQIRSLSKTHGLFFFYSSQCAYCRQFAPIVKAFAEKYQWEVLPISLDGALLPEFPNARSDNGAASALGVRSVPTLLAVEPKTGKVIPLSFGMSTHDQIEDRIRVLIMKGNNL